MRRIISALLLAALSTPAAALTITMMRPHNPILARPALDRLIAAINSNDPGRIDLSVSIYTDDLGHVEYDEQQAFLDAINKSDGRENRDPIKVVAFKLLKRDKLYPVYLVTLQRWVWKLKAYDMDGCGNTTEYDRPHWESEQTTWIVAYQSNEISSFRQADELHALAH